MSEKQTFTIPADVGEHLEKAAAVLIQSAEILKENFDLCRDPDCPDWEVHIPHKNVELMERNLRSIAAFSSWLTQFFREGRE